MRGVVKRTFLSDVPETGYGAQVRFTTCGDSMKRMCPPETIPLRLTVRTARISRMSLKKTLASDAEKIGLSLHHYLLPKRGTVSHAISMSLIALVAPGRLRRAQQSRAVEKDEIDKVVARGVQGLRALQRDDGSWPERDGITGLAAVTLLECEVAPTDKSIQKAAERVRIEAIKTVSVYTICTSIWLLDLLGDPVDVPLLEALTTRLLSGQLEDGGWAYATLPIPDGEEKRLEEHYKQAKGKSLYTRQEAPDLS